MSPRNQQRQEPPPPPEPEATTTEEHAVTDDPISDFAVIVEKVRGVLGLAAHTALVGDEKGWIDNIVQAIHVADDYLEEAQTILEDWRPPAPRSAVSLADQKAWQTMQRHWQACGSVNQRILLECARRIREDGPTRLTLLRLLKSEEGQP